MLRLEFLDARHGDCLLVHWGEPERTLLVDGGPDGVYEGVLRERLAALPRPGGADAPTIDIVCVSHVDDDHIVGVLRLLTELERARRDGLAPPFRVTRLWHNSLEELLDTVSPGVAASAAALFQGARTDVPVAASYRQGSDVRRLASSLGLGGNPPFGGPIVCGSTTTCDGLEVVVVGPDQASLDGLANKWKAALHDGDPAAIAASFADRSVPNLSSIALFLRRGTHTALLAGDARGDRLLNGLEATGIADPGGTVAVTVFKLPHHGSANNAAPALFRRIRAEHYVVCADGVKHHHPSESTLRWLAESREPDDEYVVHLTNPVAFAVEELERLQTNRRFTVEVRDSPRGIVLDLAD